MEDLIKNAIEEYQCSGCVCGCDIECFELDETGVGCGKHISGTIIAPGIGNIFLGMPKGFNRLGYDTKLIPHIFEKLQDCFEYDMYNVPTWKHLNSNGHTLVRGMHPRLNMTFIHIFLEDCIDKIDCHEVTEKEIEYMD